MQLFEFDQEETPERFDETREALEGTIALLYELTKRNNVPFEEFVKNGIRRVESDESSSMIEIAPPNVEVSINIAPPQKVDFETLTRKIEAGDLSSLTGNELLLLAWITEKNPNSERVDILYSLLAIAIEEQWDIPSEIIETASTPDVVDDLDSKITDGSELDEDVILQAIDPLASHVLKTSRAVGADPIDVLDALRVAYSETVDERES
jgi:hypothetical protein